MAGEQAGVAVGHEVRRPDARLDCKRGGEAGKPRETVIRSYPLDWFYG